MTFIIGRGFAECQILKKWKWPYLLNWVEYFDKLLCKHWYWQDLAQEIANWHFLSVEALPSSKFWKKCKWSYLWRILWWNFAYTLILTRRSQWDCQMTFRIGRGFAVVQILKKVKLALSREPFGIFFVKILHSPRDCQMSFGIGRGVAEVQILKKTKQWNWPYLLKLFAYFDKNYA